MAVMHTTQKLAAMHTTSLHWISVTSAVSLGFGRQNKADSSRAPGVERLGMYQAFAEVYRMSLAAPSEIPTALEPGQRKPTP